MYYSSTPNVKPFFPRTTIMESIAVEWTEWIVDRIMFWESDKKRKARILRAVHHFLSYGLLILIIVSHTLYPAFWLQTILLFVCGLVWVQHVVTNGCVISKVEQKWLEDESSFIDPFLELVHADIPNSSKPGILILGSTLAVFMLSLEWIARVIHMMLKLVPVSVSIQGIPLQMSSLSK